MQTNLTRSAAIMMGALLTACVHGIHAAPRCARKPALDWRAPYYAEKSRWAAAGDKCLEAEEDRGFSPYQTFVDRALGLPPNGDTLWALRISPSFRPESALSLRRTPQGEYVLQLTRLSSSAWYDMMRRMQEQQGARISLDERRQASALKTLTATRVVRERYLDAETARLLLATWDALLRREQVNVVSDVSSVTLDGTSYRVWQNTRTGGASSPPGAVGTAVAATEPLVDFVERPSDGDCALLADVVRELRNALAHARRGPCAREEAF